MTNPNVLYTCTGRYMDGQKLVAYHLVGEDGSQSMETKERIVWMIGRGQITNMRIQFGADHEAIIRGKGINLNNLPVFDMGKQQFRGDTRSQEAANSKVSVEKSTTQGANPMGQYKIVKRIMYKNSCLGYELQDYSGRVTRKTREKTIELAVAKLISNAVARRYTRNDTGVPEIILRGVDCDLAKLPMLIVDSNGKIVDPSIGNSELTVRGAYMKNSGVIRDTTTNKTIPFKAGEFIICGANGEIKIKDRLEVEKSYTKDNDNATAVCDDYLGRISKYSVEIFGNRPIQLTDKMVKAWVIMKPVRTA